MNLAIIGPPGVGKESHAVTLTDHFDLLHISSGEQFHRNLVQLTELGMAAQEYMNRGDLVPDDLVDAMMEDCLEQFAPHFQLLLTGFPKTLFQARFLDGLLGEIGRPLDAIIYLQAADEVLVDRMSGRVICQVCQQPYHLTFSQPKSAGVCDVCGGELYQRPDDLPEVLESRLKAFHRETESLVDYYQAQGKLIVVNAHRALSEVSAAMLETAFKIELKEFSPATAEEADSLKALGAAVPTSPTGPSSTTRADIILMGGPGSGKGTQAERLSKELGLIHIATGNLFREHLERESDLGKLAKDYMNRGELVPDEVTESMVRDCLGRLTPDEGFVLDGFPRALHQAKALVEIENSLGRQINAVIYLKISDDSIVARISGRLICRECHRPCHEEFDPPATPDVCDACGGALYRRADDTPESVRVRLRTFHQRTEPLFDYYDMWNLLIEVDGEGTVAEVAQRVSKAARRQLGL